MITFKKLYEPEKGIMQIAGLMSGSGSNLRKIIEHEKTIESQEGKASYKVVVIFSENPSSNAKKIAAEYGIPFVVRDLNAYYQERGKPRRDLTLRAEFDAETIEMLKPFNVAAAAYAGYMSIATPPLINAFLGVNVHPADLTVMNGNNRKYTGSHAVREAILAGEKQLRATTHLIEQEVDYGRILMVSSPLEVSLEEFNFTSLTSLTSKEQAERIVNTHQNRLKEIGDWIIFPRTLEYLAEGRYAQDDQGNLYFDNQPIPNGVRL